MARPKKDIESLKAIRINVRMTVNEYLILAANASCLGISIPDYIRRTSTGKVLPRKRLAPEYRTLFVELSRVGNNINQLTKKVNSGNHYPKQVQQELAQLKDVLDDLTLKIIRHDS